MSDFADDVLGFDPPNPPREGRQARDLRLREENRAEAGRISSIQEQLGFETRLRNRRGLPGLLGLFGGGRALKSLMGSN